MAEMLIVDTASSFAVSYFLVILSYRPETAKMEKVVPTYFDCIP